MIANELKIRAAAAVRSLTHVASVDTRLTHRERMTTRDAVRAMCGIGERYRTNDAMMTFDAATIDSAGVFLVGELERLDQTLNMPLISVTWSRDMPMREDVSMADEESSFTNSTFAVPQGIPGSNKSWASKEATAIVGTSLDIGKTIQPLPIWAQEVSWTIPELQSAEKLGRPVDSQKYEAMQIKWNMDMDEETYVGDTVLGMNGLFNHASLTNTGNAVNGAWAAATPAQILQDVNAMLQSQWQTAGYAVMANRILIDPISYSILRSTLVSSAGNISILKFLEENNIAVGISETPLKILPCKWLIGTNNNGKGPTATNSMFAYVYDKKRVRLPYVPLQRTPVEFRGIRQVTTYFGRIGGVELVYSDTAARRSNLG
jgi:hypothetical protein